MARQVLPIAGAIVGAWFGQPQLGFVLGSIVGNAVDPEVIKVPGIKDIPVLSPSEGGHRQVAYGTTWINETCLIDFEREVRRVKHRERQGKSFGPVVVTERLYRTFAIGLGEGELSALRVIRVDGKIVYDVRPGSTITEDSAAFAERFRFYSGSEDQLPDPDLEALSHNGVGNTPYYRGTAYLVFPDYDVTDMPGRIPTIEVEVVKSSAVAYYSGASVMTDYAIYTGDFGDLTGTVGGRDSVDGLNQGLSLTPDGTYLAGGNGSSPWFGWWKWNADDTEYQRLANPSGAPTAGVLFTAWDETGRYLALLSNATGGAERLLIFERSGDTLTKLPFVGTWDPTAGSASGLCVTSVNGLRAAYTLPGGEVVMHSVLGGVIQDGIVSDDTTGFAAETLAFSVDGGFVLQSIAGNIVVWDARSPGDPATIFDTAAANAARGAVFSPNGGFIYAIPVADETVEIFEFNAAALPGAALTSVGTVEMPAGTTANRAALLGDGFLGIALNGGASGESLHVFEINPGDESLLTDLVPQPTAGTATSVTGLAVPARASIVRYADRPTTVEVVVADVCDRCGLAASDLDLDALTDSVDGVTLGGDYNGAASVGLFMPAYFFDLAQPDKQIVAVKRGAAVVDTVTDSDFVEEPDEAILRGQDIEYPRLLQLHYLNPAQNYAAPAATVSRTSPDVRVRGEASVRLPVAMDETEALQLADKMLKVMWSDLLGEVTFALPAGPFAWLAPTDCLGLSIRSALYRVRVDRVEESAGVLKVTTRRDRQSAYTSNLTAIPLPDPTPPPPALAGDTDFVLMNLPALTESHDALGVHLAMSGYPDTAWTGAQVEYRRDGDTAWTVVGTFARRAVLGRLTAALAAASPHYPDRTNTLSVRIDADDELETLTETEWLREGNPAAIVYSDGTAEIVQFQTATEGDPGEWDLTTLQRGRLNTASDAHALAARFVMLDGVIFVPLPGALIGETIEFRVTSLGNSPETAPTDSIVWDPALAQTEFDAADLILDRDTNTITAEVIPRHRFGSEMNPIASVNFDGYRFTATAGADSSTVDTGRTDPTASFDVTGWSSPVTVTVALLNRTTGAGPTYSEAIA